MDHATDEILRSGAEGADLRRATMDALMDPWVLFEPVRDADDRIVDFTYVDANLAACTYNKLPREELVGRTVLGLLPGHAGAGLFEQYREVVESGQPLMLNAFSYHNEFMGGERRFYDIRAVCVGGLLSYTWRDVTDRQEEAARLAASEEHFRLIARNSSDVVWRIDVAGVVRWVSPSITRLLGWRPSEVIDRPVRDLLHPDDIRAEAPRRAEIAAAGGSGTARMRVRTAGGDWRWMSVAGSTMLDDDGGVVGGVETLRDVTAETEAAARLAESEQLYRFLAQNATDVVFLTDLEGRIHWIAPSVTKALGWRPDELLGTAAADLLHPDFRDANERARAAMAAGKARRQDFTAQFRSKPGGYRWFAGRASVASGETDEVLGVVCALRDITTEVAAQRAAEEARRAASLTRFSMDNAAVGMVMATPDGRMAYVNPAMAELFGRPAAELVGRSFADVTHPDDLGSSLDGLQRLVRGEISVFRQRKRYRRAGQPEHEFFWGDLALTAVHADTGEIERFVAQIIDVTAEVEAREAQERAAEQFRLVAENASDVVYRTNRDGLIEWVSPAVRGVLGWDPDLLVGAPSMSLVDTSDREAFRWMTQEVYELGREVRTEMHYRSRADRVRLMAVTARPLLEGGTVVGAVAGLRDVTEAREARTALTLSERQFRLAMAAAPGGMAISEVDGTIREANPALARLLGRTTADLAGRRIDEFARADEAERMAATRAQLLHGDVTTVKELVHLTAYDADLYLEHSVSLIAADETATPFLIEQFSDRTSATRLQHELEFQASHDPLTGLSNRSDLFSQLRHRFTEAPMPQAAHVGVLYLDIDVFKQINDRWGHAAGDQVLATVAARIRGCLRGDDVVGRIGGDEFVIVLANVSDLEELGSIAGKIHDAARGPVTVGDVSIDVSVSVGASLAASDDDPDRALAVADRALYEAKKAGRDRVVLDRRLP